MKLMKKLLNHMPQLLQQIKSLKLLLKKRLAVQNKQFSLIVLLLILFCLFSLPFVLQPSPKEEKGASVEEELSDEKETLTEPEVVHEDLGDEPVETQPELSIDDLEKRAVLGELTVTTKTMEKGDSLLGLGEFK